MNSNALVSMSKDFGAHADSVKFSEALNSQTGGYINEDNLDLFETGSALVCCRDDVRQSKNEQRICTVVLWWVLERLHLAGLL